MKKFLALLLVLVMVLGMAACGAKEEPAQPKTEEPKTEEKKEEPKTEEKKEEPAKEVKYKEHITVAENAQISSMNPYQGGNSNEQHDRLFLNVYNTLVFYNSATKEIEPELATEWTWADDLKSITFKLRDDVYFHNGEKMTSKDVAFSMTALESAGQYPYIDHIETPDDTTVTFYLNQVNTEFINLLCYYTAVVVNEKAYTEDEEKGFIIGTGPWMIDWDNCLAGDTTELIRNDNYWGEKPVAKKMTLKFFNNASSRLIALQNGDVDIAYAISTNEYDLANSDENIELYQYQGTGLRYVAFNTKEGPGADENLRHCIACLVNREDDMIAIGDPTAVETNTLFGWTTTGYNGGFADTENDYNVELAKEYLAKSQYKEIEFMVNNGSAYYPIAELLQEEAREIGLTITFKEVDGAGLSANSKYATPQFEALVYSCSMRDYNSDIDRLLAVGKNSNKSIVNDPEITQLLADGVGTTDAAKVKEIYGKVQQIVRDKAYYVPVYYGGGSYAYTKGLTGIKYDATNRHDWGYAAIEE